MRWLAVIGLSVAIVLGACGGDGDGDEDETPEPTTTSTTVDADQRAALLAYEEALDPVAFEGGRIVVETLRPGITDVREQAFEDDVLVGFYERAAEQLADLKQQLGQLDVPAFLEGAHGKLESAMDGYIAVAEALRAAVTADGEEREALVQEAIDAGEAADDVWDEGRAQIDEHRERLGLDPL